MGTYSFQDVVAAINGVGGSVNLGASAGSAKEGITIEATEDKNILTMGADGAGMHSLIAGEASLVTVRLLKTSPVNAQLQGMYDQQVKSSATHGKNTITVRDVVRGDTITCTQAAFKKRPKISYAAEGGMNEWTFDAIATTQVLGVGTPEV